MKKLSLLLLLVVAFVTAQAQETYTSSGKSVRQAEAKKKQNKVKGFDPTRLIIGGGFQFGMDAYSTALGISPIVGYRITDKFAAGVGLGYLYQRQKDYFELTDIYGFTDYYDFKANMYSTSVWARYLVFRNFFVHAEYEHNFMQFKMPGYSQDPNKIGTIEYKRVNINAPSALAGVGYRQPIGERSSFTIMAFYDVLQNQYSPYGNRINWRMGFNIGF